VKASAYFVFWDTRPADKSKKHWKLVLLLCSETEGDQAEKLPDSSCASNSVICAIQDAPYQMRLIRFYG
jgi:hypothetical protein